MSLMLALIGLLSGGGGRSGVRMVVDAAEVIVIDNWVVPYTGPKLLQATVGDTIEFRWDGDHNVYIHPSATCDPTGSIEVGATSPATYTFQETDIGIGATTGIVLMFACNIGNHCQRGQNMKVRVLPSTDPSSFLSTDTCANNIPTSSGLAATRCNLPEEQICCYGVQIARAVVCTCSGTHLNGGRAYVCDYDGVPDDCPNNQNPNVITLLPSSAPVIVPAVVPSPINVVAPVPAAAVVVVEPIPSRPRPRPAQPLPTLRPVPPPPVPVPTAPAVADENGNGGIFPDVDMEMCAQTLPKSQDPCETGLFAFIQCCYSVDTVNQGPVPTPDFVQVCTCLSNEKVYNCSNGVASQCTFILSGSGFTNLDTIPPPVVVETPTVPIDLPPPVVVETPAGPIELPPPAEPLPANNCVSQSCDPTDAQSCSCRAGLQCRNRGGQGYLCSAMPRTSRQRLSGGRDGVGGAGGRDRDSSF